MPYESGKIEAGDTFATSTRVDMRIGAEKRYHPIGIERPRTAAKVTPQRVYPTDPGPMRGHVDKGGILRIRISEEADKAIKAEVEKLQEYMDGMQSALLDAMATIEGKAAEAVRGHNERCAEILDGEPYIFDSWGTPDGPRDETRGVSMGMLSALKSIDMREHGNPIRVIDLLKGGDIEDRQGDYIRRCVVARMATIRQKISGARIIETTDLGQEWLDAAAKGTAMSPDGPADIMMARSIQERQTWWDDLGATVTEAEREAKEATEIHEDTIEALGDLGTPPG